MNKLSIRVEFDGDFEEWVLSCLGVADSQTLNYLIGLLNPSVPKAQLRDSIKFRNRWKSFNGKSREYTEAFMKTLKLMLKHINKERLFIEINRDNSFGRITVGEIYPKK